MPKILSPLTANAVEKAHRQSVEKTLSDGAQAGLQLRIGKVGSTWSFQIRAMGERRRVTLGSYPDLSLAQAREAAAAERRRAKLVIGGSSATFDALVAEYSTAVGDKQRAWRARLRCMNMVLGEFLPKPCSALAIRTLQAAVDRYHSRSVALTAVSAARTILRWGRKRGWHDMSINELEAPTGQSPSRERVLTDDELRVLIPVLRTRDKWYFDIIMLLLLTACRRDEIADAAWSEIDLTEGRIVIPPERYKTKVEMIVPLPRQATALLKTIREEAGEHTGRVFPLTPTWSRFQEDLYDLTRSEGWQRHDLRRTAATMLGNWGLPPHIVEVVLGHGRIGGGVHSIYNRSRYYSEHRDALQRLADYYDNIT